MPGLLRPRTGWAVGRSRVALIVACVAASSAATAAATATTVLSGWVTDTMGGYVAGVTVVLVDAQGKEQRKGRTDKAGHYELEPATDGSYSLEARQPGFKVTKIPLELSGGRNERDLRLELGPLTERVVIGFYDRRVEEPGAGRTLTPRTHTCKTVLVPGGMGGRIEPPTKLNEVLPAYPERLWGTKTSGRAVLRGVIGTEGIVKQLVVVTATHNDFAEAALEAVVQWRFDPTRLNCVPVETNMLTEVDFGRVFDTPQGNRRP